MSENIMGEPIIDERDAEIARLRAEVERLANEKDHYAEMAGHSGVVLRERDEALKEVDSLFQLRWATDAKVWVGEIAGQLSQGRTKPEACRAVISAITLLLNTSREKHQEALAQVAVLLDALIWCSGSPDFNEGGQAREGWLKGPSKALSNPHAEARALLDRLQVAEGVARFCDVERVQELERRLQRAEALGEAAKPVEDFITRILLGEEVPTVQEIQDIGRPFVLALAAREEGTA